ncbi:MAG: type II secretion system minor pseudopilin GspK [Nitrospiria bacterium]
MSRLSFPIMKKPSDFFLIPLKKNQSGIVLLMVLFVIVLLVTLVIEFDYQSRVELKSSLRFINAEQAISFARSGLLAGEEVLRQNLSNEYDGLDQFWAQSLPPYPLGDGSITLSIQDESGKINLNLLNQLQSARAESEAQIRRLFYLLGVDDRLVDEIILWMACENDFYYEGLKPPYTCQKNHPLDTLSELRLVRGMTDEIYGKLAPYLTVYPQTLDGNKKINVNTAAPIVLQTLYYKNETDQTWQFDITPDLAEEIIQARPIKNENNLVNINGLKSIGDKIKLWSAGVKSQYFTIISTGEMKGTEKKLIETIARPTVGLNTKIIRFYTRLE